MPSPTRNGACETATAASPVGQTVTAAPHELWDCSVSTGSNSDRALQKLCTAASPVGQTVTGTPQRLCSAASLMDHTGATHVIDRGTAQAMLASHDDWH